MRALATRPALLADISTPILLAILVQARIDRDHVAARLIDTELFYRQPIVTHDTGYGHWMATRGDYDLDCTVGSGRTEAEAIEHLIEREEDQRAGAQAFDDGGMAEERARHP
jgi:hypothetical protein